MVGTDLSLASRQCFLLRCVVGPGAWGWSEGVWDLAHLEWETPGGANFWLVCWALC